MGKETENQQLSDYPDWATSRPTEGELKTFTIFLNETLLSFFFIETSLISFLLRVIDVIFVSLSEFKPIR